jgi:DNA-binding GntR family transcriptional regulator
MKSAEEISTRQPLTVIDNCVRRLRGGIMVGDLRPGQKLIEADLCQELGISRASLREALRVLEAERLIELVPNRGPSVAKLGEREIEEIHEVWALLTGEAVQHFAQIATGEDVSRLQTVLTRLKQALRAKNPLQQLNVTNSFFGYIYVRCGNDVLIDVVTALVSRLNFLRAQSLMHDGWRELCAQEIEDIMKAIRAKKPVSARQATRRHIESACSAATQVALMPKPDTAKTKNGNVTRFAAMERWTRASRNRDG